MAIRSGWSALCVATALALAVSCAAPGGPGGSSRSELQLLLDRQAQAVADRDLAAYLGAVDPRAGDYRAAQRQVFGNLGKLPIAHWSYRITGITAVEGTSPRRATVQTELSYQLRGYDQGQRTETEQLDVTERDGRWYVSGERADSTRQLWEQGELTVLRGEHSLVLGVGRQRSTLRTLADHADQAVPEVDRAWPRPWPRRVVVLAPATVERMAQLLSAPPANYQGIAAVTTGEAETGEGASAERILINPGAYGLLSKSGRQIVMTHETTHVATRAHTTAATPLWLSEGFADWAGYLGTGRSPQKAAPELRDAVAAGDLPEQLPRDEDFDFSGSSDQLARAYEAGWLACRMIASDWGEAKLTELYAAAGGADPDDLDTVLKDVLDIDEREFTARWRAYIQRQLG